MAQTDLDIALIGYQDQGNLGMGYLAATAQRRGYSVELFDVREGAEQIAARLAGRSPVIVGFSLIFQAFLPQFRQLALNLRAAGIASHFTMGGHFPSLCHDEALAHFPEVDSLVLYEGEETLLELAARLKAGADWGDIDGIAYLRDGRPVTTRARPLVPDLDSLPFPYRPYPAEKMGGFATLPVLASRGCARTCSFCSIHTFYRTAPGKVVRVRKPAKVVEEMLHLERYHQVRVFLFQDDDFPLWKAVGRRWATELADRMKESGLSERTVWKISCRAEYVEADLFAMLREAGLFLVYMGIESGNEGGLDVLHKQISAERNLEAVETLKALGIAFGYGFMLFDPSTSFDTIRENLGFLRKMVGDGSAAATFSRMLPYGGTPIRDQLQKEGRLRGDITKPDYVFLDPRINEFHRKLSGVVRPWIHGEGLSYQLNYVLDEFEMISRLVPGVEGGPEFRAALRSMTRESNERLLSLVERFAEAFEAGEPFHPDPDEVRAYCESGLARLVHLRNEFVASNIYLLREATAEDGATHPVMAPQVH
jgi:radical SAM superfamily enzyme YgiQ (UPF0313 family)